MVRTTAAECAARRAREAAGAAGRARVAAFALLLAAVALAPGCAGSDDPTSPDSGIDPDSIVQLELIGFPDFAQRAAHFELWISFAEVGRGGSAAPGARHANAFSAGKFRIREGAQLVGLDWQPTVLHIDPATPGVDVNSDGKVDWPLAVDAFVTIEPEAGDDGEPAESAIIGGGFRNGTADLAIDYVDAIDQDFTGAGGSFVFESPTTFAATDSANSPADPDLDLAGGIWFAAPGGVAATLSLPTLPDDSPWIYEGWVSLGFAGSVSLGRFRHVGLPDSDGPGPLGPLDGPGWSYPGSDFPTGLHAQSFSGGTVYVTLEPAEDQDGPGPFFLVLAQSDVIPDDVPPGTTMPLRDLSAGLPIATVTIPFDPTP